MHRSLADALGEDEADVLISHKSVYQKSLTDAFMLAGQGMYIKRKRRLVLSAEVDQKIKDLYEN